MESLFTKISAFLKIGCIYIFFRYMASILRRIAADHSSVVAVVGKGHLQGIQNNWQQPIDVSVNNSLLLCP